ncbi:uncharacterized protein Z520_07582 [Fonsecaea multimorphosa CBS 102226]|uniref:DNA-directed RNA polymerase I subunit RPA49 n=1 Tax=Fonsecaea multimorphosa CBS 102226 TaxID=1442371 RepID=A0A0D2JTR5_9EURO|nr:uncharacterized protein Z520_07582 [Fonsecaea multimorphosa CBS 102226]KIX96862.1 hypothetical protein Z520_07582 [Fonsecaea multimorphosa CBS 102226]OAL22540.1 hypothetical protein AYO22_07098 [Fonsecaea multimorphosa]
MAEKKRKAGSLESDRPSKKPQTSTIKVTHLSGPDVAKPLVASSPGVTLPSDLSFDGFSKREPSSGRSSLLLQSSDHPTIDYVATESGTTNAAEKHVKHYIAVFDPASNKLKVVEARKMTVRSTVRQLDKESDDDDDGGDDGAEGIKPAALTTPSRAALTQAFGTKKSKRAVASVAENRLLARDGENDDNPLSNALLSSIKEEDDDDADVMLDAAAAGGASSRANKPLPQANLDTADITQVYALSSLVFPGPDRTTLSQMPIAYWKECAKNKKPVSTHLRFVATRVGYLTQRHLKQPDNQDVLLKLQILRYIQLLVEIHKYVSHLPRQRRIAAPESWPRGTTTDSSLSTAFKGKLMSHFFPTGTPTTFNKTLFTSTILALTLHIPPPKFTPGDTPKMLFTELSDMTLDLAMPHAEIHKLYRELGCKIESMTDAELHRHGWDKVVSPAAAQQRGKAGVVDEDGKAVKLPKPKFAKLRFPIEFRRISAGRPGRR